MKILENSIFNLRVYSRSHSLSYEWARFTTRFTSFFFIEVIRHYKNLLIC